jgi:hypothetical protein
MAREGSVGTFATCRQTLSAFGGTAEIGFRGCQDRFKPRTDIGDPQRYLTYTAAASSKGSACIATLRESRRRRPPSAPSSTRTIPRQRFRPRKCRKPRLGSVYGWFCSMPAPKRKSIRRWPFSHNNKSAPCYSTTTHSSVRGANSSHRWRSAIGCRRYRSEGNSPRLAACSVTAQVLAMDIVKLASMPAKY